MRLNKKQRRIRAVLILAAIVAAFYIMGHIWWTDSGYCWGSAVECLIEGN